MKEKLITTLIYIILIAILTLLFWGTIAFFTYDCDKLGNHAIFRYGYTPARCINN